VDAQRGLPVGNAAQSGDVHTPAGENGVIIMVYVPQNDCMV